MTDADFSGGRGPSCTRRRFVEGAALTGLALGLGWPARGHAVNTATAADAPSRKVVELAIGEQAVNFTGRRRTAITVNRSLPAPVLRFREGDDLELRVTNHLREDTSIHWHGILLPANMDGVPGLSFHGIRPGETFTYRFPLRQSGTYWYHSHSGMQEARGLYGALIVDPCAPEPHAYERDHAIVLSDWSDTDPHRILANLKKQGSYYNHHQRTVGDFFRDVKRQGWAATWADRRAWGTMRMTPTDLADVSAATYTYLVNGHTPAMNWTGLFRRGERVRLRFINAAAMTYFDVRIPGHRFTVIAADGQPVQPVEVEEFRLGVAETLDVIVTPQADACTIFAQSMDRTGYARATLATVQGLVAAVPALDPRPLLTMDDMGHGGHAGHGTAATAGSGSDAHAGHGVPAAAQAPAPLPQDPAHHGHHDHHAMMAAAQAAHPGHDGHGAVAAAALRHPASETRNPFVDMQTMAPAPRLADPGIGLRPGDRPEQRRVLSYADLKSAFADPDGREPSRSIELHLTGHMERYVWSFDGIPFGEAPRAGAGGRIASLSPHSALAYQGDMSRGFAAGRLALHPASTGPQRFTSAEPLRLTYGERLRIVLVNDTMMEHPIHLHGMWSDLEDEEGRFLVRKHTISMPPGTRRSFRVTADALGRWAFHCHLLMHMDTGMFREVRVEVAS